MFYLQPRDKKTEKIIDLGSNNKKLSAEMLRDYLKANFYSSRTLGLFTAYFDTELYQYAASYYNNYVFGRDRSMYAVVGITRVLEDVEISQRNHSPYQDVKRFLEQDFTTIHKGEAQIPANLKPFITARIDIRFLPETAEGDFSLLAISDKKAEIIPANKVYQIHSYAGQLTFTVEATVAGQVLIWLIGLDVRDSKDRAKRIPYWIDYTKLTVGGKSIFDTLTPAWHDKFYLYSMKVKAEEEIKIQVEWLPHRSDT